MKNLESMVLTKKKKRLLDRIRNMNTEKRENIKKLIKRRKQIKKYLDKDEVLMSLTSYPMLGCKDFLIDYRPGIKWTCEASQSFFVPDEAINLHPRFKYFSLNLQNFNKKHQGKT